MHLPNMVLFRIHPGLDFLSLPYYAPVDTVHGDLNTVIQIIQRGRPNLLLEGLNSISKPNIGCCMEATMKFPSNNFVRTEERPDIRAKNYNDII